MAGGPARVAGSGPERSRRRVTRAGLGRLGLGHGRGLGHGCILVGARRLGVMGQTDPLGLELQSEHLPADRHGRSLDRGRRCARGVR